MILLSFLAMALQDAPLALRRGDPGYAEAFATVRQWVRLRDTYGERDPARLLVCDWRPDKRIALVETIHDPDGQPFRIRAIYSEVGGRPVQTFFQEDGSASLAMDRPFVEAALKTCAPLMAR